MTTKPKKWELPKDWRYNVKELRMERKVPVYDENEGFMCHSWGALVPEDIIDFISNLLSEQKKELRKEIEKMKIPEVYEQAYKLAEGWGSDLDFDDARIGYNQALRDVQKLLKI